MDLSHLLTSRTVAAIGLACIVLSALAALWAMVKLSYQRALGKPMPRNALTATLDVLAELAVNVVGAVSRALKLGTGESLFRPTVPLTPREAVRAQGEEIALDAAARPHAPAPIEPTPFDPQARITRAELPPIDGQRGSVSVRALLAVVVGLSVVLPLGVAITGCPNWQRPACTTPGAYSCAGDQPMWCSTTRELTPIGDEPCAAQGRACGLRADGRAGCLRAVDVGAQ
jgi:hypothetical protein